MFADAIEFVRHFVRERKPIAAICHGPRTLIDACGVEGKKMASWPSLKTDLSNAGAKADLITSRVSQIVRLCVVCSGD
jgi:putative intracellular protease/amidase